jgi:hypothetical protein
MATRGAEKLRDFLNPPRAGGHYREDDPRNLNPVMRA